MPLRPTMSIMGLYSFNPDLFSEMVLPDAVDPEVLAENIVMECAELECIYPDADFLQKAVGMWSRSRILTWDRMALVLTTSYDPFINIKRDELRTITETRDLTTGTEGNQVQNVNAFDAGTDTRRSSADITGKETNTGTVTTTDHLHVEGDSAITDAQDVMKKEVEVREMYDLYKYIIHDFKRRFCLLVY